MNTRVLMIEDNPDDALLYRRLLEKEGYAVEVAANGQEGRRLLFPRAPGESPDFDVVLTISPSLRTRLRRIFVQTLRK